MSQKKVDEYKEQKKNRKELIAKAKKKKAMEKIIGWVIAGLLICALVFGIVLTVVNSVKAKKEAVENYYMSDYSLLDYSEIVPTEEAADSAQQ